MASVHVPSPIADSRSCHGGSAAGSAFQPVETIAGDPAAGLLLICDHASNAVPAEHGTLGLPASELERHIGYDIGAGDLTRDLAARFGAPAVLTRYSRLLIDPNRGEDDPTLVMRLSDGTVVPGNARIDRTERQRRVELYWRPYQRAIAAAIDEAVALGRPPLIVSIHSFTPVWRGLPRPWHCAILWDADPRAAEPLVASLRADGDIMVGDNEPYDGALRNDTLFQHGTARGIAHVLIEVRQDLIGDESGVAAWGDRLARHLAKLVGTPEMHVIRSYGSRTGPVPAP